MPGALPNPPEKRVDGIPVSEWAQGERGDAEKQMAIYYSIPNFEMIAGRAPLFADRLPEGETARTDEWVLQQRYDKSKRREIRRDPLSRRPRHPGWSERSITPSNPSKHELAARGCSASAVME